MPFARRIAFVTIGATTFEKPDGVPLLRRVIFVPPFGDSIQEYVVSIANGPSEVAITNRSSVRIGRDQHSILGPSSLKNFTVRGSLHSEVSDMRCVMPCLGEQCDESD